MSLSMVILKSESQWQISILTALQLSNRGMFTCNCELFVNARILLYLFFLPMANSSVDVMAIDCVVIEGENENLDM